jgi:hypothetical protein
MSPGPANRSNQKFREHRLPFRIQQPAPFSKTLSRVESLSSYGGSRVPQVSPLLRDLGEDHIHDA